MNTNRKVGRPKHSTVQRLPIGRAEHETVLQHVNQVIIKDSILEKVVRICTILHHTGMRAGEICLLRKSHILNAMRDGKFSLSNETKTKTPRLVILSKTGVKEFKELFEMEGYEDQNKSDYIFVDKHNKVYTSGSVVKLLNNHIKAALGELYSSHSYRAGYCSDLFSKAGAGGGTIVQKLIGHRSLATSLRYNFASEKDLNDVLEMVR